MELKLIVLNNVRLCWPSWETKSKIIYSVQKQMKLRQTNIESTGNVKMIQPFHKSIINIFINLKLKEENHKVIVVI